MASDREDPDVGQRLKESAWVRSLALQLVGDSDLAEDLSQETLLADLSRGAGRLQSSGPRRSWLAGILRNLVKMQRRQGARRNRREQIASRPEAVPSTAELVEQAELQQRLVAEVLALSEPYRSTLLLRYLRDVSIEDIARQHGVEPATVRSRTHRGLAMLRSRLDSDLGPRWKGALLAFAVPKSTGPAPVSHVPQTLLLGVSMKLALKSAAVVIALGLVVVALQAVPGEPEAPALATGNTPGMEEPATSALEELPRQTVPVVASNARGGGPDPRFSSPGTVLAGRVLTRDERPVEGAEVILIGSSIVGLQSQSVVDPIGRTTSDRDGAFRIPDLAPSVECALYVTAEGFAASLTGVRPGDGAEVILDRSSRLFGRVVSGVNRRPLSGVRVRTVSTSVAGNQLRLLAESVTDEQGRYQLADLPLRASVELEILRSGSAPLSQTVLLQNVSATRHDILLADLGTVRGVVVDSEDRSPVAGALIRSGAVDSVVLTETDEHGRFQLLLHNRPTSGERDRLRRGQRHFELTDYDMLAIHAPGFCQTVQPVAPLVGTDEVTISLKASGGIEGTVVDSSGAPVPAASLYWVVPGFHLVEPGGWVEPGPTSLLARTADDGTFSLPDVLPGIQGTSLAVRRGNLPPHRVLDVAPGRAGEVRNLLIQVDTGVAVRGRTFVNGRAEKTYVHLDGDAGPESGVMIQTDADGHFAFHGVVPGEYRLRGCTADGTAIWSDTLSFSIDERAPDPVELFIRAELHTVAGTVVNAAGEPLANTDVFVFPGDATSGLLATMTKTRSDGSFQASIKPGDEDSFTIAIPWEGFRVFERGVPSGAMNVRLVAPAVAPVTLALTRQQTMDPIGAVSFAFRHSASEPWSSLFGGREVPLDADGTLQVRLPLGHLEVRVASLTAGLKPRTLTIHVVEGGSRVTVDM